MKIINKIIIIKNEWGERYFYYPLNNKRNNHGMSLRYLTDIP